MPRQSPTISRISVTSSATATMLISERTGRRTRFPRIMRFIMTLESTTRGLLALAIQHFCCTRIRLIQMHHFCPSWLLQRKLLVRQGLVDVPFEDVQGDIVIFPRTLDFNRSWEHSAGVIFVVEVAGVGGDVTLQVIDALSVRQ